MISHLALSTAFGPACLGRRFFLPKVTHPSAIERMSANAVRDAGMTKLIMTTGYTWAIPREAQDRRFTVIDVGTGKSKLGPVIARVMGAHHA